MCRVGANHVLSSGDRVFRASRIGIPHGFESMCEIQTLWLPTLLVSEEGLLGTQRGLIPAGDVRKGDWLRMPKPDASVGFHMPVPAEIHGPADEVWRWFDAVRATAPVSIVDMMESTVRHWRQDVVLVQRRELYPWYLPFVGEGRDAWWLKVIGATRSMGDAVEVRGEYQAYGVQVRG